MLFLDVDFQRLKERVVRVFRQLVGDSERAAGKSAASSWCFASAYARCMSLVLGADLVIKVLIIRGAFGSGRIGHAAIQVQYPLQLAQRRADVAALIGRHRRLVQLLLLLARACVLLFQTFHVRKHLQRAASFGLSCRTRCSASRAWLKSNRSRC